MNKVYALYEDNGIPDGLELLAVCDSLDRAMSISNSPLDWTYNATGYHWTYTQTYEYYDYFVKQLRNRKRFFVIETFVMNDLEAAE